MAAALAACVAAAACGKKGPPLPPLVKIPVAPTDLAASRRGSAVDLAVTVPASNTDGTRPANISHVEIYALTAPVSTSDTVVLKDGARVATAPVKSPRDPNDTVDVDDPTTDLEPLEGTGLDQGATAHLREVLTAADTKPRAAPRPATPNVRAAAGPLVGPPLTPSVRLYLALGVNQKGKRGPVSKRVNVPLIDPPERGAEPVVTYDESAITVTWMAGAGTAAATAEGLLPSRSLVSTTITQAYNVYEVAPGSTGGPLDVKLTAAPTTEAQYVDHHVDWGKERCFAVRNVSLVDGLAIEGDLSVPRCVTPVDTFAPAQPNKPTAIALTGAINILWDASEEPDLAGYLVFRGARAGAEMTLLTPEPIDRTNFTDTVDAGFRAVYGVVAVDKAGNRSPMSPVSDEETAR